MPRWLLGLAVVVVFAATLGGALAVQVALSAVSPQMWWLTGLAVAFVMLLGLVPRLRPLEERFGPFLCYGSGLLLAFLYSNDLSRVSATTAKVLELGLLGFWVAFGLTVLTILVPLVYRASALHAWILAACVLGWLVAYFSGDAGSGGSWAEALMRRLGWDRELAESAVHWTRKGVHFTFYGLVGLVGWALSRAGDAKRPAAAGVGLGLALLHALFDESRQLSTVGRDGTASDVLLDMAGALVFVAIAWTRAKQ